MGPDIKKVERSSQATPLAQDFMKILQGWLSNPTGGVAGPSQRGGVGSGTDQYMNSPAARIGGVNTAGQVADHSGRLIGAVEDRAGLDTGRAAAQIRESFGQSGNRISSSLAREEGRFRNEAGMNLNQLIAGILTDQGEREQGARMFDVEANQNALMPFLQAMQLGSIPEEIIATPGWGSQLMTGLMQGASAYLTGGASAAAGNWGGGNTPTKASSFNAPQFFPGYGQPSGLGLSAPKPLQFSFGGR